MLSISALVHATSFVNDPKDGSPLSLASSNTGQRIGPETAALIPTRLLSATVAAGHTVPSGTAPRDRETPPSHLACLYALRGPVFWIVMCLYVLTRSGPKLPFCLEISEISPITMHRESILKGK